MKMRTPIIVIIGLLGFAVPPASLCAQEAPTITIRDHRFEPAELKVPAGQHVTITVVNDDPTPEEFESKPMKVEKVIPGKSKAVIRVGPLKAGRYPFVGEYHESTAKGVIIAQ
jgi:plastocyanin